MMTTTLAAIRAQSPCRAGWMWLLKHVDMPDDAPLPLATILDSNGINDALWVAYRVIGEPAHAVLMPFLRECAARACDCADRVRPIIEATRPGIDSPRKATEAARACVAGTLSEREPRAAYAYAADAAAAADTYAAADAADAYAHTDADAARMAARREERAWQTARLREYFTGTVS